MVKKILWHIICVAALCAAVLGVFWFNASPASRKTVTVEDMSDPDYVEDPSGEGNHTVMPDSNPSQSNPNQDTDGTQDGSSSQVVEQDPEKKAYDAFISSLYLAHEAEQSGYTELVYCYGDNTVPVYAVKLSDYTDTLLPETVSMKYILYRFDKEYGSFFGVQSKKETPMLFLYGGLLMENRAGTLAILSWLGEYECSAAGYYPAYATDSEGRYLFEKDDCYFYYDTEQGCFVQSEKSVFYGVHYDSALTESTSEIELKPYYDAEIAKWGYVDLEGNVVIKAQYYRAYEFSENGIAAVQKNSMDGLLFINTVGKVVLDSHFKYYKYNGNNAFDWYRAPTDLNEDAIGCLRFDHGYMRVTAQTYALINSTEVLETKQALVDADGNMLRLPPDYNLVAYSDGVAVLEKNGYYGYYSYEGRWLTEPLYKEASAFVGGLGTAKDSTGKYHVFDTEGNEVIPGVFDYISSLSMGKMLCYKEGEGWLVLTLYQKQDAPQEDTEDNKDIEDKKEDETLS